MSSFSKRKTAWLIFGGVLITGLALAGVWERNDLNRLGGKLGELVEPVRFEEKKLEGQGEDKIVLLRAEGLIYDAPMAEFGFEPGTVSIEKLARQLNQAQDDGQVKAVILLVNSPGGTATASQAVAEKLADFKQSGKKLIVLMTEMAASGATSSRRRLTKLSPIHQL